MKFVVSSSCPCNSGASCDMAKSPSEVLQGRATVSDDLRICSGRQLVHQKCNLGQLVKTDFFFLLLTRKHFSEFSLGCATAVITKAYQNVTCHLISVLSNKTMSREHPWLERLGKLKLCCFTFTHSSVLGMYEGRA